MTGSAFTSAANSSNATHSSCSRTSTLRSSSHDWSVAHKLEMQGAGVTPSSAVPHSSNSSAVSVAGGTAASSSHPRRISQPPSLQQPLRSPRKACRPSDESVLAEAVDGTRARREDATPPCSFPLSVLEPKTSLTLAPAPARAATTRTTSVAASAAVSPPTNTASSSDRDCGAASGLHVVDRETTRRPWFCVAREWYQHVLRQDQPEPEEKQQKAKSYSERCPLSPSGFSSQLSTCCWASSEPKTSSEHDTNRTMKSRSPSRSSRTFADVARVHAGSNTTPVAGGARMKANSMTEPSTTASTVLSATPSNTRGFSSSARGSTSSSSQPPALVVVSSSQTTATPKSSHSTRHHQTNMHSSNLTLHSAASSACSTVATLSSGWNAYPALPNTSAQTNVTKLPPTASSVTTSTSTASLRLDHCLETSTASQRARLQQELEAILSLVPQDGIEDVARPFPGSPHDGAHHLSSHRLPLTTARETAVLAHLETMMDLVAHPDALRRAIEKCWGVAWGDAVSQRKAFAAHTSSGPDAPSLESGAGGEFTAATRTLETSPTRSTALRNETPAEEEQHTGFQMIISPSSSRTQTLGSRHKYQGSLGKRGSLTHLTPSSPNPISSDDTPPLGATESDEEPQTSSLYAHEEANNLDGQGKAGLVVGGGGVGVESQTATSGDDHQQLQQKSSVVKVLTSASSTPLYTSANPAAGTASHAAAAEPSLNAIDPNASFSPSPSSTSWTSSSFGSRGPNASLDTGAKPYTPSGAWMAAAARQSFGYPNSVTMATTTASSTRMHAYTSSSCGVPQPHSQHHTPSTDPNSCLMSTANPPPSPGLLRSSGVVPHLPGHPPPTKHCSPPHPMEINHNSNASAAASPLSSTVSPQKGLNNSSAAAGNTSNTSSARQPVPPAHHALTSSASQSSSLTLEPSETASSHRSRSHSRETPPGVHTDEDCLAFIAAGSLQSPRSLPASNASKDPCNDDEGIVLPLEPLHPSSAVPTRSSLKGDSDTSPHCARAATRQRREPEGISSAVAPLSSAVATFSSRTTARPHESESKRAMSRTSTTSYQLESREAMLRRRNAAPAAFYGALHHPHGGGGGGGGTNNNSSRLLRQHAQQQQHSSPLLTHGLAEGALGATGGGMSSIVHVVSSPPSAAAAGSGHSLCGAGDSPLTTTTLPEGTTSERAREVEEGDTPLQSFASPSSVGATLSSSNSGVHEPSMSQAPPAQRRGGVSLPSGSAVSPTSTDTSDNSALLSPSQTLPSSSSTAIPPQRSPMFSSKSPALGPALGHRSPLYCPHSQSHPSSSTRLAMSGSTLGKNNRSAYLPSPPLGPSSTSLSSLSTFAGLSSRFPQNDHNSTNIHSGGLNPLLQCGGMTSSFSSTCSSNGCSPLRPTSFLCPYDYILVLDFEATCEEFQSPQYLHEIIEFPVVLVDTRLLRPMAEFHSYVKPRQNPELSDFCKRLTGIEQHQIDNAPPLEEVLRQFERWCFNTLPPNTNAIFATDGSMDLQCFMYTHAVCRQGIPFPPLFQEWLDVKKIFSSVFQCPPGKIKAMLEVLHRPFEGRLHSGIDDARNIANIIIGLLQWGSTLTEASVCHVKEHQNMSFSVAHNSPVLRYQNSLHPIPFAAGSSSTASDAPQSFSATHADPSFQATTGARQYRFATL